MSYFRYFIRKILLWKYTSCGPSKFYFRNQEKLREITSNFEVLKTSTKFSLKYQVE